MILTSVSFTGRTALVTGASRNIRRAITLTLSAEGVAVAVNAKNDRDGAEATVRDIERAGGRAAVVLGDVSDADPGAARHRGRTAGRRPQRRLRHRRGGRRAAAAPPSGRQDCLHRFRRDGPTCRHRWRRAPGAGALELGGKSTSVVFADADLDRAARVVAAGFTANSGQVCSANTRLLVERTVHDDFVARVAEIVSALKPAQHFGPIITPAQFEKVQEY